MFTSHDLCQQIGSFKLVVVGVAVLHLNSPHKKLHCKRHATEQIYVRKTNSSRYQPPPLYYFILALAASHSSTTWRYTSAPLTLASIQMHGMFGEKQLEMFVTVIYQRLTTGKVALAQLQHGTLAAPANFYPTTLASHLAAKTPSNITCSRCTTTIQMQKSWWIILVFDYITPTSCDHLMAASWYRA